jgi:hypothetical protein
MICCEFLSNNINDLKNRKYLIELNVANKKCFDLIEQSCYVIILDDSIANDNSELAKIGQFGNAKNRFFDKSFQSIITKNGRFTSSVEVNIKFVFIF